MPAAGADFVGVVSTSPQAKIFELGKNSPTTPPCFLKKVVGRGGVVGCNRPDWGNEMIFVLTIDNQ